MRLRARQRASGPGRMEELRRASADSRRNRRRGPRIGGPGSRGAVPRPDGRAARPAASGARGARGRGAGDIDGRRGAQQILVVHALQALAGADAAIGDRKAAAGVELDESGAGRPGAGAADGDGQGRAASVVVGAGGGRTRRDESLVGHDGNLRAMDAYSMMVWGGAASRAPNVIQPRYARMDGRYRKAGRPDSAAALRCEGGLIGSDPRGCALCRRRCENGGICAQNVFR